MRISFPLAAATVIAFCAGCASPRVSELQRFEFKQPHMGTLFTIKLYAQDAATARAASDAAFARIADLENVMSDYDPESELMQLCEKPFGQPVRVSHDLFEVLEKSQRLARLSGGAFDPTIGPVIRLWRRARRTGELPSAELLAKARAAVGWQKLKLDPENRTVTLTSPNMQLDLGGIGKGFAVDNALEVLTQRGITRALVAGSGDIAVSDPPPGQRGWSVGIGAPDSRNTNATNRAEATLDAPIARTLLLKNAAVSTSGDAEQFVEIGGKRYSHIVDPRTGIGVTERIQVTVVGRRATDTDGFATAVNVLGVEEGMKLINRRSDLAALIIRDEVVIECPRFRKWITKRPAEIAK